LKVLEFDFDFDFDRWARTMPKVPPLDVVSDLKCTKLCMRMGLWPRSHYRNFTTLPLTPRLGFLQPGLKPSWTTFWKAGYGP